MSDTTNTDIDRETCERQEQLARHLAMLDDSPTTTTHRRRAREILAHSRPLPGGLVSIPRDWCIIHFERDAAGVERVTPVYYLTRQQYRAYIQRWYGQEHTP